MKRSLARRNTVQGMDLCRHHPQAGNKGERGQLADTRAAKAKSQEEYTAADREVKRSIRKDKRDYIDDIARQAETAAELGNLRDLYLVTKKLTSKFQQTTTSTSLMTWRSCHTVTARCRTRPLSWRPHQQWWSLTLLWSITLGHLHAASVECGRSVGHRWHQ